MALLAGPEVPATEAASASVNAAADAAVDDAAADASFSAAHVPPKDASSLDADVILSLPLLAQLAQTSSIESNPCCPWLVPLTSTGIGTTQHHARFVPLTSTAPVSVPRKLGGQTRAAADTARTERNVFVSKIRSATQYEPPTISRALLWRITLYGRG